jgi:hypothetical protein
VTLGDLWTCPHCGRRFADRNQTHTCGTVPLADHLAGRSEEVVAIFERLVALAERNGPVTVLPERTRFRRIETFPPRNHLHAFRLERLSEVDEEVADRLREAYDVGMQRRR